MRNTKWLALCLSFLLGLGSWSYLYGVFLPFQKAHQPNGSTWENRSDIYPRWIGARELILHGRNPYSVEVTREIQIGYYGRAVDLRRAPFPSDEQRFIYPLFVVFLLAPTVTLPFSAVQLGFGISLFLLMLASVPLWLRALGLRFSVSATLMAVLFTLGSWPVAQGVQARQLSLLAAFLLAASGASIASGKLRLAGVLLALTLIKPQLAVPLVLWFLLWGASCWHTRKSLLLSFGATFFILLAGAEKALPHWFLYWRESLPAYLAYTGSQPGIERLLGHFVGRIASFAVILLVAAIAWRYRRDSPSSPGFPLALCLVLAATLVIMPTWSLASYNEVLLLPALLWLAGAFEDLTSSSPHPIQKQIFVLTVLVLLWEPVGDLTLALRVLIAGVPVSTESVLRIPQYLYFIVPTVILSALLGIRFTSSAGQTALPQTEQ